MDYFDRKGYKYADIGLGDSRFADRSIRPFTLALLLMHIRCTSGMIHIGCAFVAFTLQSCTSELFEVISLMVMCCHTYVCIYTSVAYSSNELGLEHAISSPVCHVTVVDLLLQRPNA